MKQNTRYRVIPNNDAFFGAKISDHDRAIGSLAIGHSSNRKKISIGFAIVGAAIYFIESQIKSLNRDIKELKEELKSKEE